MRKWLVWLVIILAALATGFTAGYFANPVGIPPVAGYAEGRRINFIHPEASDPKVAELLTEMLNSPVIVVPSLPGPAAAADYAVRDEYHIED